MIINTDEQFLHEFRDDFRCNMFLKEQFYMDNVICPYCNTDKCYQFSDNKRYKCRNSECYKMFQLFTGTYFHSNKFPVQKILLSMWYYSNRGRLATELELSNILGVTITQATFLTLYDKIEALFEGVDKFGRSKFDIFRDAVRNIHLKRNEDISYKKEEYKPWFLTGIDDISQRRQYDRCVKYARRRIIACKWIYVYDFAKPEEIITDVFLRLEQNGITDYNSHFIATMINSVVSKHWNDFIKSNPLMRERLRLYKERYKQEGRKNMKKWYIKELICINSVGIKYKDIKDPELIETVRKRLAEKRKIWGTQDVYDYRHEVVDLTYDETLTIKKNSI